MNYAIFRELCDRMRFEVDCAKSHHRVISEGLLNHQLARVVVMCLFLIKTLTSQTFSLDSGVVNGYQQKRMKGKRVQTPY